MCSANSQEAKVSLFLSYSSENSPMCLLLYRGRLQRWQQELNLFSDGTSRLLGSTQIALWHCSKCLPSHSLHRTSLVLIIGHLLKLLHPSALTLSFLSTSEPEQASPSFLPRLLDWICSMLWEALDGASASWYFTTGPSQHVLLICSHPILVVVPDPHRALTKDLFTCMYA